MAWSGMASGEVCAGGSMPAHNRTAAREQSLQSRRTKGCGVESDCIALLPGSFAVGRVGEARGFGRTLKAGTIRGRANHELRFDQGDRLSRFSISLQKREYLGGGL